MRLHRIQTEHLLEWKLTYNQDMKIHDQNDNRRYLYFRKLCTQTKAKIMVMVVAGEWRILP